MIAVAVPTAITWTSGETGFEFIVLGAVIGFATWYWGRQAPRFDVRT